MKFFILIIFFCTFTLNASIDILKKSDIFIDKDNSFDIENIDQAEFKRFDKSKVHRGYTDEIVWIRFSISNEQSTHMKKVLVIDNQMLDNITLYTKTKSGYDKQVSGVLNDRRFDDSILDIYFDIDIKPNETESYYLKVSSLSCAVYFTLKLMDKTELYNIEIKHQLILALFFGAAIVLIIYNLFICYFTKNITYLYYSFYLIFIVLNYISYTGMGLHFLPQILGWENLYIDAYLAIHYLTFMEIFALLFFRSFLDIKRYKNIDKVFKTILFLCIMILIFTSTTFYPIDLVIFLLLISLIFIVCVSYYMYFFQKIKEAGFLIVGWTLAILGWSMLALHQYGYYNLIDEFKYFYEFSVLGEILLFSIALSAKLNKTKELEQSVKRNAILTKELHHRVKNNMQFIISIYRLKLSSFINEDIKRLLNDIEKTIQTMSYVHELLYTEGNSEYIETKTYIKEIVEKNSALNKDIRFIYNVDAILDMDKSIIIGVVLNELITNSIKHAFKYTKYPKIEISLNQQNDKFLFTYKDNGCGFDTDINHKSFGLRLIEKLISDDLNGKISLRSSKGIEYKISYSS